ncbi:MAG: FAD-dependent oxidoreductase [Desulfobacter sp.]|nr:MAG: FAD-dependent oxidoreductase [Desulfobacter sp.]
MARTSSIIIIGGGVIGLSCAHFLMAKGADVTLIEKQAVGSGASHGNCGLLYYTDVLPLCAPGAVSHEIYRTLTGTSPLYIKPEADMDRLLWLARFALNCRAGQAEKAAREKYEILEYSAVLFADLLDTGILQCDFGKKGVLLVFSEKKYFENYKTTNDLLRRFGPGYRRLGRDEALALEPALSPNITGAWHNETDQHLRPEFLMAAWKNHLVRRGLTIEEKCEVTGICRKGQTIKEIETPRGRFSADAYVLAAGAWSAPLARTLELKLPVQPGKGYSITMGRPGQCPEIPCMLYEKNMVVTPWKSGYRLGGTMEFSGFSQTLNRKRLNKLLDGAGHYLKTPLGRPLVEEWTGLRPMSCDDMPLIGRAPGHDNLIVATGHGMLGLTLATGTGKLVTDLIYGVSPRIDPAPYSLDRF